MDLNEKKGNGFKRHPWELARTYSFLAEITEELDLHKDSPNVNKYINVGAGDMYFDKVLTNSFANNFAYAVDIGYKDLGSKVDSIKKFNTLEEIQESEFDYALMMDSLEYMPDDAQYLCHLAKKIKNGGYIFLTLPSFQLLHSEHDENVGNLRRYSKASVNEMLNKCNGELKIVKMHYFYFSLLIIRVLQKVLHIPIDPEHKVTTGWRFDRKNIITRFVRGILILDYHLCKLSKGVIPGLSLMVAIKKYSIFMSE